MTTTITRHEDGTTTQVGGVTRVSHHVPSQEAPQEAPQSLNRVGGSVTRFDGRTGAAETTSGFASHQHRTDSPNHGGSVMATMRSEGTSKTVQLVPGDESSRTLLSVALREGLIVESAPGHFTDRNAPSGAQQAPNEAPQGNDKAASADPMDATVFDKAEYAIWSAETAHIPDASYDRAVAGVTAALSTSNPEKLEGVVMALAQAEGWEPAQAQELIDTGIEWHAASLSKDLQKNLGMSSTQVESLYDQLRERSHPRLAEAIQRLAVTGRSDVFREIALDFKRHAAEATDMSSFHKAGFETRVDRDSGDIMVRIGQGAWKTLAQVSKK